MYILTVSLDVANVAMTYHGWKSARKCALANRTSRLMATNYKHSPCKVSHEMIRNPFISCFYS